VIWSSPTRLNSFYRADRVTRTERFLFDRRGSTGTGGGGPGAAWFRYSRQQTQSRATSASMKDRQLRCSSLGILSSLDAFDVFARQESWPRSEFLFSGASLQPDAGDGPADHLRIEILEVLSAYSS